MLNACFYNSMHKYLDDPSYTRPSPHPSHDPLTLLHRIRDDRRFDNLFPHKGDLNIYILMEKREAAVLEYWNALAVPDNPTQIFEACQRAAVEALVATRADGEKHDFFLVHLLTTSHALRHLLPSLPARWHVALARQWWLLVVTIYVAQHRPEIRRARVDDFDLRGRDWGFVVKEALEGQWRNDAHYVKGELLLLSSSSELTSYLFLPSTFPFSPRLIRSDKKKYGNAVELLIGGNANPTAQRSGRSRTRPTRGETTTRDSCSKRQSSSRPSSADGGASRRSR